MCAEREPMDCHRTILVSRHLATRGVEIVHLLAEAAARRTPMSKQAARHGMSAGPVRCWSNAIPRAGSPRPTMSAAQR